MMYAVVFIAGIFIGGAIGMTIISCLSLSRMRSFEERCYRWYAAEISEKGGKV